MFGAAVVPLKSKSAGRGKDVDAVRRGFGAKSKVPVVMPSKSNGGGRKKFGSASVNFVVVVVVVVVGIFVATTADEMPCRYVVFF